ncbi:MAG: hypothetical protein ACKOA9_08925 [Actinomycetota bacterium]
MTRVAEPLGRVAADDLGPLGVDDQDPGVGLRERRAEPLEIAAAVLEELLGPGLEGLGLGPLGPAAASQPNRPVM